MRRILLTSFIRVRKIFLALTLMLMVNFIASGQVELIAAMLIGYALAGFYIISTAMRLSSIAQQKSAFAKRQMLFGLVMRILMIFVVFAFAILFDITSIRRRSAVSPEADASIPVNIPIAFFSYIENIQLIKDL